MYVVEMNGQLFGPFYEECASEAYAWGEANCDPDAAPGKRFLVRDLRNPTDEG